MFYHPQTAILSLNAYFGWCFVIANARSTL